MLHFFVTSIETEARTTFELAATQTVRLLSLDYLSQLYADGKIGFFFRSVDGSTSYELHRVDNLTELDARLKANPQWAYAKHDVVPVSKTGDMVRELTAYLGLDANKFFEETLSRYENKGFMSALSTNEIRRKVEMLGGDYLQIMSQDEEPIDEEGTYTIVAKRSNDISAVVPEIQLRDMWMRALRAQVAHLNSDIEFIDYNPIGKSEGLLIGKGDVEILKRHIEATEIFPDTVVTYTPALTPRRAAQAAVASLRSLQRDVPTLRALVLP